MIRKIFPNKIDLSKLHSKSAHCDCEWKFLFVSISKCKLSGLVDL